MAKAKKVAKAKQAKLVPQFDPGVLGGGDMPLIVADRHGTAWYIDPQTGTAKEVEFK